MKNNKYLPYIIVFAISFLWMFLGSSFGINIYDEGIGVVGSMRILNGEMPYIDFWTVSSPAWYYIQAFYMKFFGEGLLAIRIISVLINSFSILMIYKILESQRIKPLFSSMAVLMFLGLAPALGQALPLAILLVLVAIYLALNYKRDFQLIVLALVSTLLFTVRHDFGVYIFASMGLFILFEKLILNPKSSISKILIFSSSSLFFLSIYLTVLYSNGMLSEYFNQSYLFVFKNFASMRSLPFPNPIADMLNASYSMSSKVFNAWQSTVYYMPFIIFGVGLFMIKSRRIVFGGELRLFVLGMLSTLFLTLQAITRSDFEHSLPALIIALLIVPITIEKLRIDNKYIIFAILLLVTLPPLSKKLESIKNAYISEGSIELLSKNANGIKVDTEQGDITNELLDYIANNCNEEYIYSGCLQHDKVQINDVMIYYFAQKKSPTKYSQLHPGQVTTAAVQDKIINSLEAKLVKHLVLYKTEKYDNNMSAISSGVFDLDNYIKSQYLLTRIIGNYYIFRRY